MAMPKVMILQQFFYIKLTFATIPLSPSCLPFTNTQESHSSVSKINLTQAYVSSCSGNFRDIHGSQ